MGLQLADLRFERPADLVATGPPETRGLARDEVRLLVSEAEDHHHARFHDLGEYLEPGDLVVANQSGTLPASLPATHSGKAFLLNCCTDYGNGLWLTEPRRGPGEPGPLDLPPGDTIEVDGHGGRVVGTYPGLERLVFVRFDPTIDLRSVMGRVGEPIRYGYLEEPQPLDAYRTVFAATPGSAEMPSAGRPFSERVLDGLRARGIGVATITLHTGVSSLEIEYDQCECYCTHVRDNPLYAEPFRVPPATAAAVNRTRRRGGRVIAVGTTVVRALETAVTDERVRPTGGFTRTFITPERGVEVVDGLLTGLHDPETTHLAMLYAIAGRGTVMEGYDRAIEAGYLWHEFGDSHLLLPREGRPRHPDRPHSNSTE